MKTEKQKQKFAKGSMVKIIGNTRQEHVWEIGDVVEVEHYSDDEAQRYTLKRGAYRQIIRECDLKAV